MKRRCLQATYIDRLTASRVAREFRKKEGRYYDPQKCGRCGWYHLVRGPKEKEVENGGSSVHQ